MKFEKISYFIKLYEEYLYSSQYKKRGDAGEQFIESV